LANRHKAEGSDVDQGGFANPLDDCGSGEEADEFLQRPYEPLTAGSHAVAKYYSAERINKLDRADLGARPEPADGGRPVTRAKCAGL
jgi:hypothetical protein